MRSLHINTPLIESVSISKILGKDVYLKFDALQPPGSFKIRGIGKLCQVKASEGFEEFISPSGGNAGLATAYAARELGKRCTVVLPSVISSAVIEKLQDYGATVLVFGDTWEQAEEEALRLVQERKSSFFVHPFDHKITWEGHSSLVDELAEAISEPDIIVLAVGGGGLLAGIEFGLKKHGWGKAKIIACETEGTKSFNICKESKKHAELESSDSVATSLAALKVSDRAFEISQQDNILSYVCSDEEALEACRQFAADHRVLVEPACGAALSAAYKKCAELKEAKRIVIIICGGVNIHPSTF